MRGRRGLYVYSVPRAQSGSSQHSPCPQLLVPMLKLPTLFGHKVSKGYSRNPLTLTDCSRMLITSPVFALIGLALNLQTTVAQTASPSSRSNVAQTASRVLPPP